MILETRLDTDTVTCSFPPSNIQFGAISPAKENILQFCNPPILAFATMIYKNGRSIVFRIQNSNFLKVAISMSSS